MERVTGYNVVAWINQLPKNINYNYINPDNKGLIRISRVELPQGPVYIKRWNPSQGGTLAGAKDVTISTEMIWRYSNAFVEGQPINIDRVLGGSYNTRSVLESLLAHTPQFYHCMPGRILDIAGNTKVEGGHKHLLWLPNDPHNNGVAIQKNVNMAISEIPASAAIYDNLTLPDGITVPGLDIETVRRHTQIQIALYLIGLQLGYRTWIAQNDRGVRYNNIPLVEQRGIVQSLQNENLIAPFDGAVGAGLFIDCIWFKNGRLLPAVMEVEHSTGVTSGLTRMMNLKEKIPAIQTRYVIVAADEDREHVFRESNKEMFRSLRTQYFPYSAVEELFVICQRRNLHGVTEEFLDCYMENTIV